MPRGIEPPVAWSWRAGGVELAAAWSWRADGGMVLAGGRR